MPAPSTAVDTKLYTPGLLMLRMPDHKWVSVDCVRLNTGLWLFDPSLCAVRLILVGPPSALMLHFGSMPAIESITPLILGARICGPKDKRLPPTIGGRRSITTVTGGVLVMLPPPSMARAMTL